SRPAVSLFRTSAWDLVCLYAGWDSGTLRLMNRFIFLAAALLVIFAAADTSAQGFLNPFIATTLSSPTDAGSSTKPGFGISFGSLGNVVGGETEITYFPELIDNSANAIAKNKVFTISGDTLIGPTIGRRVKPYF